MAKIVVGLTGATGHIGGLVLKKLLVGPDVGEVRTVARRPLPASLGNLGGEQARLLHAVADLRSSAAREALQGCDLVYHLAAQVWQGKGPAGLNEMESVNVEGTRNIVAGAHGVVVASSASVYGAWPDNPLPMDEGHPPRPNPECAYAKHKLIGEKLCAELAQRSVVARLSAVLGPHADARVSKAVRGYRLAVPAVAGAPQAVQWMDEDDAARALIVAGHKLLEGTTVSGEVFNFSTVDWLDARELAALAHSRVIALPRGILMTASELGRRLGVSPFGADRASLIGGPLAMSVEKAARLLGWSATKKSTEVMAEALERDWRRSPLNRLG